jgi:hypothetical protein
VRVAAPMDPRRPRTPRVAAGPGLLLMHFKRRKYKTNQKAMNDCPVSGIKIPRTCDSPLRETFVI